MSLMKPTTDVADGEGYWETCAEQLEYLPLAKKLWEEAVQAEALDKAEQELNSRLTEQVCSLQASPPVDCRV